ncbi:mevalonate kinase [Gardnerella pickettii]|uniref:mevalonate kinase n=1 Tax=Gardnerella pickettii TaxID=2914924 RepID=UPI0039EF26C0
MTECNTLANRHASNPCDCKNERKNENICESAENRVHNRIGVGQTCAKVILFGEHSVVYGYSAVALPLKNLKMRATVSSANAENVLNTGAQKSQTTDEPVAQIENNPNKNSLQELAQSYVTLKALNFCGPLKNAPKCLNSIKTAIYKALQFANWRGEALQVETACDFPPERGLGSSAAAAGAVIRAILDYYAIEASEDQLFELTQEAENVAHGKASGLDAKATASARAVRFLCGEFSNINIRLHACLVLADSGCKGQTRDTVEALRKKRDLNPHAVDAMLEQLGKIAISAQDDLELGQPLDIGLKMSRAHKILAQLGVSTPLLDELVSAACKSGALGAKLTGGGGGGCVIALAQSYEDALKVALALERAGAAKTWIVEIGS